MPYPLHFSGGSAPGHTPRWIENPQVANGIYRPRAEYDGAVWTMGADDQVEDIGIVGFDGQKAIIGGKVGSSIGASRLVGCERGIFLVAGTGLWFWDRDKVMDDSDDFEEQDDDAGTPLVLRTTLMNRSVAYCGLHSLAAIGQGPNADITLGSSGGTVAEDYHVFIIAEYGTTDPYTNGSQCRLLIGFKGAQAQTDGIEDKWYELIVPLANGESDSSIRHFHGVFWFGDVGTNGLLVIATGDAASGDIWQATMLVSEEGIPHLIANASTWKTRWGLDISGTTRRAWFDTADANGAKYCADLLTNEAAFTQWSEVWVDYPNTSSLARTVELVADSRGEYAYWIPDMTSNYNNAVMRMNLATLEVEQVGTAPVIGTGWFGTRLSDPDGVIVLSAQSAYDTNSSSYVGNDEFARLYAVDPDGGGFTLLKQWHRNTGTAALNAVMDFDAVMRLGSTVILRPRSLDGDDRYGVGAIYDGTIAGTIVMSPDAPYYRKNIITTDIEDLAKDYDLDAASDPWYDNKCTNIVRESDVIAPPPGFTRVIESIVDTAQTSAQLMLRLSDVERAFAKGRWNTFSVLFMLPADADADMEPELHIWPRLDNLKTGADQVTPVSQSRWPTQWRDGLWHRWSVRAFIPPDFEDGTELCDKLELIVQTHTSGNSSGAGWVCYWTDQGFAPGCSPVVAGLQADGSY